MPPKGSTYRVPANDALAYDESTIAKQKLAAQAVLAGRGRRNGTSTLVNGTTSKDMVSVGDLAAQGRGPNLNDGGVSPPSSSFGWLQLEHCAEIIPALVRLAVYGSRNPPRLPHRLPSLLPLFLSKSTRRRDILVRHRQAITYNGETTEQTENS
jgi:hypothetical protein